MLPLSSKKAKKKTNQKHKKDVIWGSLLWTIHYKRRREYPYIFQEYVLGIMPIFADTVDISLKLVIKYNKIS